MNDDFRKRVFTPVVLPLGLMGGIAVFAWSLSRVFLALPALASTMVALLVAGYVLGLAAVLTRQKEITGRSIAVGLALGLVGVVGAGAVANAIGPREFHVPTAEGEEAEDEEEEVENGEPELEIPDDAVVFVADDNVFNEAPESVPSGTVTFAIVNEGNSTHNVHIEELDETVVEAGGGGSDIADVELEAGETYNFVCDIPGHEQTMNGQFTVED